MRIRSLATLVALAGCGTWLAACSSDSAPTGTDAGSGGDDGTGGKTGTGGTAKGGSGGSAGTSTGGTAGSGGGAAGGAGGGSGGKSAGGSDAGTGGEPGDSGVVTTPDASAEAGVLPDAGKGDGAVDCSNSRCISVPYPQVLYPALNPASDDKAMLGKFLFWDEQMGGLGTMACGTCHRSAAGGSDPRTHDKNGMGIEIAHLPGPDKILDVNPGLTSDDIRGAAGVVACSSSTTITGTGPQVTTRKPPSYFDAMFNPRNFWDGRAGDCKTGDGSFGGCFYDPDTLVLNPAAKPLISGSQDPVSGHLVVAALEAQSVGPPNNPGEMACADTSWAKIEARLTAASPLAKAKAGFIPQDMKDFAAKYVTYPKMFAAVFGATAKVNASDANDIINSQRIAFAIATHERRLTSNDTPWDRWIAGDDAAMTAQQIRGYVAFLGPGRCSVCHNPPLFTDSSFHNIGFHKPSWDPGREAITNLAGNSDIGKFKTPTLRNVGLREPFGLLHEGEGPGHDLNSVMALYKLGGQRGDPEIAPLIDPALTVLTTLTQADIADIIEFLRNGLTDPRVKNETAPFDRPHLSTE
ncbi:MAG TPA: cytochrome c peroxidase [Polyangiaceae bacterium]|jgi:cytochrome c peroxidase|nr:cytochrome c peroxidase [Polyangiaceae bacterium]